MAGTERVPLGEFGASDAVDLITGLAWPVVVAVLLWRLLPLLREIARSRAFTVKAGGMEISVQEASEQLASRLEDVREQVSALRSGVPADGGTPVGDALDRLGTVLWVDDYPENNAFEVDALQRRGIHVLQARRTSEALQILTAHPEVSVVVTDMGREDDGADAGVRLVGTVRERWPQLPAIVYASAPAVARWGEAARSAGAIGVTASATELLALLAQV